MTRRWRVALLLLLAVEALAILWLVLNPSPAAPSHVVGQVTDLLRGHGVPRKVARPIYVEFVLNAGLFAPFGVLAALLWPRVRGWVWVAVAGAVSAACELFQWAFLNARSASVHDVVANTLGMAVGVGVAAGVRAVASQRSASRLPARR